MDNKQTHRPSPDRGTLCYFCSAAKLYSTLCDPMELHQPGFPVLHYFPEFAHTQVESIMPSNLFILCCPLLLLPSVFPRIWVLSNELTLCIRWPKYWSFTFSISLFNEYSGLISFGIDRFDLLAVQGTLNSLLQHHNLKASVLRCSAFFMVQLSHPYMTTGKTIVLTIQTFVCKVVSLVFNTSVTLGKRTSLFLCAPCFKSEIAWHDFTGMWKKCQIKLQR